MSKTQATASGKRGLKGWRTAFGRRFFAFNDRRNASAERHLLTTKNLFIFPTRRGFLFLGFVAVLWMLGTNYQNNLILSLTFMLVSVFIVSILHTFSNLSGLDIALKGSTNVFAGEQAVFYLGVTNPRRRDCEGLGLRFQDSACDTVLVGVAAGQEVKAQVPFSTTKRGLIRPRRLLVESVFPLGLLRCWTWLRMDAHALVYPRPVELPLAQSAVSDDEGDGEHPMRGGEDFSAFRDYQPGDPLKHVAWKLFARERGLFTKEFSQNLSREVWLDFYHFTESDVEARLSALCYWALDFHQRDEHYGLVLPGLRLPPDKGENHRAQVLELLARFDASA